MKNIQIRSIVVLIAIVCAASCETRHPHTVYYLSVTEDQYDEVLTILSNYSLDVGFLVVRDRDTIVPDRRAFVNSYRDERAQVFMVAHAMLDDGRIIIIFYDNIGASRHQLFVEEYLPQLEEIGSIELGDEQLLFLPRKPE